MRRRIEERIDEQSKTPNKWMPWFSGISVAFILAAVILAGGGWNSLFGRHASEQAAEPAPEAYEPVKTAAAGAETSQVRSAMLIGLREDHPAAAGGPEYSTYRTVLLGPEQGELRKIAEVDNILMPFKMDFWLIAPQRIATKTEETRTLGTYPAGREPIDSVQIAKPDKPLKLSEKLLFAGNRYLTVEQTAEVGNQGGTVQYRYVWVKELQNLMEDGMKSSLPGVGGKHVTLRDVFGKSVQPALRSLHVSSPPMPAQAIPAKQAPDDNGESWAVVRKEGRWVPQVALYGDGSGQDANRYRLQELPMTPPESVATYDRLDAAWSDIQRVRPGAKDAYSSPNQELVAIVGERDIVVYPLQGQILPSPLLSIGPLPNESVVMVQWAAAEPYIGLWKEKGRSLQESKPQAKGSSGK
ncbi:hypothetical protein LJK88_44550 [Paenibacillus sp. P26]|nr:hypothetical protein LJK88_44550 [Paenibacillus sp. P26]